MTTNTSNQSVNIPLIRSIFNGKPNEELLDIIISLLPDDVCMEYIEFLAGFRPNMNEQWIDDNREKLYDIARGILENSGCSNVSCLYIRNNNGSNRIAYETPSVICLAYRRYYISDDPEIKGKLLANAEEITSEDNLSKIRSGKFVYDCANDPFKGLSWRDYRTNPNDDGIAIDVPEIVDIKMNINDII